MAAYTGRCEKSLADENQTAGELAIAAAAAIKLGNDQEGLRLLTLAVQAEPDHSTHRFARASLYDWMRQHHSTTTNVVCDETQEIPSLD